MNKLTLQVKKAWANKWIKNIIILILVLVPLLTIDQVTKGEIFNGDKSGTQSDTIANWKIIAFRSQFHTSTTFLDFIGTKLPLWSSLLIDYILVVAFGAVLAFSRTKFSAISASIALVGILGNTIDASHFHGVRNVFFIPWADRGTFNFADVIIVIGSVLTGFSFVWSVFKKPSPNKKPDSIQ